MTWTNSEAIDKWSAMPESALADMDADGDFCRRQLLNPVVLRMLGDVAGQRVLDAGCGNGYLSRMLARLGASVIGVDPADAMIGYSRERESELRQGISYVQADLANPPDLGGPFDAVVSNVVLCGIPDWRPALRACVSVLRPGGLFVFSVVHPCFEGLWPAWRSYGHYRVDRYLEDYVIPSTYAPNFHRPLSAYLTELALTGARITEVAEPGLDPTAADTPDLQSYVHLPNFVVISATR